MNGTVSGARTIGVGASLDAEGTSVLAAPGRTEGHRGPARTRPWMASIVVLLGACSNEHTGSPVVPDGDFDDDGATEGVDCDDRAADVYPGALEVDGDGIDQNCDGVDQQAVSLRSVGLSVAGKHVGSGLGFLSLGAGDLDGDGRDDALVGAGYIPSDYEPPVDEVWLVRGAGGAPSLSQEVAGDVGALSSFDVLRDGDDVLTLFGNETHVYGFWGLWPERLWTGDAAIDLVAFSARMSHGDLDGDGRTDVAFNMRTDEVLVHTGPLETSGNAKDGDVTLQGSFGGTFGYTTAVGDANGDGIGDLVVSAMAAPGGAIFVFTGPLTDAVLGVEDAWARFDGDTADAGVGSSLPGALRVEDLTGDGDADLLIPASHGPLSGRVWLVQGPTSGTHVLTDEVPHLDGDEDGVHLGTTGTTGPDLNGNGAPELLVSGADAWYPGVIFGFDLPIDPDQFATSRSAYAIVGDTNGDAAGASLAAGDFDGDGRVDALIGATGVDVPDYEGAGTVTLVLAGALGP